MADTDNVRAAKRAAERTGLITVIVIFALIAVAFVLLLTVGHRSFGSLWFGVAALALGSCPSSAPCAGAVPATALKTRETPTLNRVA